ncbi:hypothetical protein BZG36_01294 [Bifiguratus adelaidae]|uniref:glutathione synthase n=1 Tax=Bifiguratus adelaidae TaxID=1938954 RepID=A0A261Y5N8_9FUNG|nr:hypothetical protein BZG36_01294 [Bifiguratus adelaidae]
MADPATVNTEYTPRLAYTNFPAHGFTVLPVRNIVSTFVKNEVSYFAGTKTSIPTAQPKAEAEGTDVLIIHPGSRNLYIGRASDTYPRTIPHVIARRIRQGFVHAEPVNGTSDHSIDTQYLEAEMKTRMSNAKRRPVHNAKAQVTSFNNSTRPEVILDHNDPYKVDWTDVHTGDVFVGEKALNVPLKDQAEWPLRYPIRNGTFNSQDYATPSEVIGDIETIWTQTLKEEFEINFSDLKDYNVALVIPDLFNKAFVKELIQMLLFNMRVRGVLIQQESICATFGAGLSVACVVDIGAQKTSVACVEEGVCLPDSRVYLNVGGDDITASLTQLLERNRFPYRNVDLTRSYNFKLMESIKERYCTMHEADISVQVYDFYVRVPDEQTRKYQFKVYDEVFFAPMCMFYPHVVEFSRKLPGQRDWATLNISDDILEDGNQVTTVLSPYPAINRTTQSPSPSETKPLHDLDPAAPGTPGSPPAEANPSPASANVSRVPLANIPIHLSDAASKIDPINTSLDVAIGQSIHSVAANSEERIRKFYTSIILVGGGGKVPSFEAFLQDRILFNVLANPTRIDKIDVLPAPREMDPRLLVWKGMAVLSRLESAMDSWISAQECESSSTTMTEWASFSKAQLDALRLLAIDWALAHGLVVRPTADKQPFSHNASVTHAPFALFPSPFPKAAFDLAVQLQPVYNELIHTMSQDAGFLAEIMESLTLVDDFMSSLYSIYKQVQEEGPAQTISLGLHRCDYLLHVPLGSTSTPIPQQVEFNTIASSFGALSSITGDLHRYLFKMEGLEGFDRLPKNETIKALAGGIAQAHQVYGSKNAIVTVIVQPNERNVFDQRWLEYTLLESHGIRSVRKTLLEVSQRATLGNDRTLFIDNHEISVIYFRAGYGPGDYPSSKEWNARLLMEQSKAIKCPTVAYQLVGAKKVQQVLAMPGALERFVDPKTAELCRTTFAGLYSLDTTPEGQAAYKMALENPDGFVMKPQREGGGNNVYGQDIVSILSTLSERERSAYILMDLIRTPPQRNIMVREGELIEGEVISELGVYGIYLSDGKTVYANKTGGHLLRTKAQESKEGGVAAGFAVIDSPLLL